MPLKLEWKLVATLAEATLPILAAQLEAGDESSECSPVRREVYALMKCSGSPCDIEPHCWHDSFGKHYMLRTHHLKALIEHAEQGHSLQSHDGVLGKVREQLIAEEQQRLERRSGVTGTSTPNMPPVNILNVLPTTSRSFPAVSPGEVASAGSSAPCTLSPAPLVIPGPRDVTVKLCSEWQQSQVADMELKIGLAKACGAPLKDGLDLEPLYEDRDSTFFVKRGAKRVIANYFVRDIES